jgi:hypothetical protein
LTDGTWKNGYGYYVGKLGVSKDQNECAGITDEATCTKASAGCLWYGAKQTCYPSGKSAGDEADNKCGSNTEQGDCEKTSQCLWYSSGGKKVCYEKDGGKKRRLALETSKEDDDLPEWRIVDRVIAPKDYGEYVLQWRWDNEQTPQIWTTCADIDVVEESSDALANALLSPLVVVVSMLCLCWW